MNQKIKQGKSIKSYFVYLNCFNRGHFYFGLAYASSDVKIMKQNLVYPVTSFISDLGGSFGMFIGFSFLTFFDCFTYLYERLRTLYDRNY